MQLLRLALALALVLVAAPSWAAIAHVQTVTGVWSSGTTFTATLTATNTNMLAVGLLVLSGDGADKYSSISDGTNTYTPIDSFVGTAGGAASGLKYSLRTFYVKNLTGGALTVTVTVSDSTIQDARIAVTEYSGAHTTAPLDVHAIVAASQANPGTGADAVTTPSVTTTTANEIVVGWTFNLYQGTPNDAASGTSFTSRGSSSAVPAYVAEDLTKVAAGSVAATFTMNGSDANTEMVSAVAAFKVAASAAASPRRGRIQ